MITGIYAFLHELLPIVACPTVFILAAIMTLSRKYRYELPFNAVRMIGLTIMVIVFLPPMTVRFYYWLTGNITVRTLDPANVGSITIGDHTIIDPGEVKTIVAALNQSIMYSPNHEERGPELPMTIYLWSGKTMHYRASKFKTGQAELLFVHPKDNGYWADGYVIVPKLADVLSDLGYPLPDP